MLIRKERPSDYNEVYSLVKEAFRNAEHTDGKEQDLVVALRESEAFISELSLVAELDGVIVGHIMFTKAKVGKSTVLALAPLSVLPEQQRQGVGSALVKEGHRIAVALGYEYVVVLGSDTYYPKLGYVVAEQYGMTPPFEVPKEYFMAYQLQDNVSKVVGVMQYDEAFGIE